MKDDNKIRTAAAICEVWDGKTIKRVRGGDGTTILGGRRLSMHLMVQPNIANTFLSDPVLRDQGILSRILVSSPKSAAGTRLSREVKDTSINALEKFKLELNKILHLPLPIKAGCLNELQPKAIILSTESKELYHEFANNIEKSMLPNGAFEHIKGLANKLPEHVLRIAATFALFEDISVTVLEYKYVKMATKLCEYYSKEALRLATEGTTDPNILLAEKLLDWLHNNWEEDNISLPDIYQRSLNKINTKAIAVKIVSLLVGHGCLRKNEEVTVVKGQSRKDSWKIIKP